MSTSSHESGTSGQAEFGSLAAALTPVLREVCGGRLSEITWFRSAWQAGGASTGTATYQLGGRSVEALVKLPVGPSEHQWTVSVGSCPEHVELHDGPTPRVLAAGTELGGYDLAWMVLERLPGSPLSASINGQAIEELLHAAAMWYQRSDQVRPRTADDEPRREDWASLLARCRRDVKDHGVADSQRWNEAIHRVQKLLPRLVSAWESRAVNCWCHGDLHPGNALWRSSGPPGAAAQAVLIDLALVHPGHWVEDALYLERLFWGKPDLLGGVKPVSVLAKHRRQLGLSADDDYAGLANIRRVLMAASVPAFLEHEGHPRYVHAALEILERLLPTLGK